MQDLRLKVQHMEFTRNEDELLTLCARTHLDEPYKARILKLLHQSIDWTYLLDLGLRHHVLPLLYNALSIVSFDYVPSTVVDKLKAFYRTHAMQKLQLTAELVKIVRAFDRQGIPIIPLKGPVLAELAYQNVSLRDYQDLDILVPKTHIQQAVAALIDMGYEMIEQDEQILKLKMSHHFFFVHKQLNIPVELHWDLAQEYFSFSSNTEIFWKTASHKTLFGLDILVPQSHDLLLYLCGHGSRHHWERLSWICDIAELLQKMPEMNWERLIENAKNSNSQRILFVGLFITQSVLDHQLPNHVLNQMGRLDKLKTLTFPVEQNLFAQIDEATLTTEKHLFHFQMAERWQDKIIYLRQFVRRRVEPTGREEVLSLPKMLSFVYYPIRILRLIKHYSGTLARLLLRQFKSNAF